MSLVYQVKGKQERWIAIDRTLGGDVVLLPYRLRRSILRCATYRQRIVTQDELAMGYVAVGEAEA